MTTTELIIYCDEVISEQKDIIEDFGNSDDGLKKHCEKTIENFKQIQEQLKMWDKIIENIKEEIALSEFKDYPSYDFRWGLEFAIDIIKKYKKELENENGN